MTRYSQPPCRNERGVAIILALFMMLAMSVLGTSLMFVSKTETLSSHNYRLMSEARYGAESGVHVAANYLMSAPYGALMPVTGSDPTPLGAGGYDTTTSPVKYGGAPVVLSSTVTKSNYPVGSVKTAFASAFASTLNVNDAPVTFKATATLRSMRLIHDSMSNLDIIIQTWEVTGEGSITGARDATVEVSATVERQTSPIYAYAAFATDNGCAALDFGGGGFTNSYDSSQSLVNGLPATGNYSGNVGTNGNLNASGNTTVINGSLSTPRTGVGSCAANNVTAETLNGGAQVTYGLTQLSQNISYPTPAAPNPLPPTTSVGFTQNGGCPAGISGCTVSANGATLDPSSVGGTITLGNVSTNGNSVLVLKPGTYVVNSLTMNGSSKIQRYVDPSNPNDTTPIIFKVAGVGQTTPITITGNGIVNNSYVPSAMQFQYGGTGNVTLAGGDNTAALFYAPNAIGKIAGGADLWGAIVVKKMTDMGGAAIHYDRQLQNNTLTAGNYMMSAFTWKNY